MPSIPVSQGAIRALNAMHDQWGKEVQTIRGGTQVGLRGCPYGAIRELLKDISSAVGKDVTEAWSIRMGKGGYHAMHNHPEGNISGVYYLTVGSGADLILGDSHIKPVAGMLITFPSSMVHGTTVYEGETPRLTVAFDLQ